MWRIGCNAASPQLLDGTDYYSPMERYMHSNQRTSNISGELAISHNVFINSLLVFHWRPTEYVLYNKSQ